MDGRRLKFSRVKCDGSGDGGGGSSGGGGDGGSSRVVCAL